VLKTLNALLVKKIAVRIRHSKLNSI